MNASDSYLEPKKGARAQQYSMDVSLLDADPENLSQAQLSFADVTFQMENEMDISAIPSETPQGQHEEDKEDNPEKEVKEKEGEKQEEGKIDGSNTSSSPTKGKSYADSVKPNKGKQDIADSIY